MDWGSDLWDQHEAIERHTQSGLETLERYVKFVRERAEIEQTYAKHLRTLCKKYSRRGNKDDQESKSTNQQAFQEVLNELNDYAGVREQLSEKITSGIGVELSKSLQDLRLERKNCLAEIKKAQQNLESTGKQLEASKKRFEKEWREAEKANLQTERVQQEASSTKADAEKARQHAQFRTHMADDCKNEYASQLQRFNSEQRKLYHTEIPTVYKKLQDMEERRIRMLADGYLHFSEMEKLLQPNINKCLDSISAAGNKVNEKQDSTALVEQYRTGALPPGDVEFEDYSQCVRPSSNENVAHLPKVRIKQLFRKNKVTSPDKTTVPSMEDLSRLAPEEKKKHLQERIVEVNRELQLETEQSEALMRMKSVYEQNSQLGDPNSLQPQITNTAHNIARLRGELHKYQEKLASDGNVSPELGSSSSEYVTVLNNPSEENFYECGFDEDFDVDLPIGQCKALYDFEGGNVGEVSMKKGEHLSVMAEDQGDGWVRVQRSGGDVGYVPASYIQVI